jgi:hypothetical protein
MNLRQQYINIILDRNGDGSNVQERLFLEALPMSDLEALVRNESNDTPIDIVNSNNSI